MFGVARALNRNFGSGVFDLAKVAGGKLDVHRSDVLLQALQLRRARDRNDPRLLLEQPGEGNLRGCGLLPLCDPPKKINQRLIRFPSLRSEARNDVADVRTIERGAFVDLAGEEAFAE